MNNCLIIDSNKVFAERFHSLLPSQNLSENDNYWDSSTFSESELGKLSDQIKSKLSKDSIILINAEAKIKDGYFQDQSLVELAFWLRCKHKIKNPIVFYSFRSISQLLKTKSENFISLSPGCYHLRFPFSKQEIDKISSFEKIENLNQIKPFLKPRINLEKTRHTYANYSGMVLMMLLAEKVWNPSKDILDANNPLFDKLTDFLGSLEYHLLYFYYNLSVGGTNLKAISQLKNHTPQSKILLVDDLADGWKPIISQMVYGNSIDRKIASVQIKTKKENDISILDLEKTKAELEYKIRAFKPHLILLDLRLHDEKDKQDVETLGGFKLLKNIKSHPIFKGLPIIMITASSNAETTKKLIEAGAESVWTKPGIDEGLSSSQILRRYGMLVDYVKSVFFKFEEVIKLESQKDIEESRLKLLHKIEFIKYRSNLSRLKSTPHYFNNFSDIFVDTNMVIEDSKTLCNVVKLTHICGKTKHKIIVDSLNFDLEFPKVVFDNYVIDEIIHHSKEFAEYKPYFWKIGLVAYEVIRSLFQDNLVRTELNFFKETSLLPICLLRRTDQDSTVADKFIMEDIIQIISGNQFELIGNFKSGKKWKTEKKIAKYDTPNTKVLLLTNESKTVPNRIPDLLTNKFNSLSSPQGTFEIMNISEFNKKIEKLRL